MRQRRQPDRRRTLGGWALRAAVVLAIFAAGVALGQAFDDSSPPGSTRTSVRTLVPETLVPETVTVVVTTTP
ncbi:MAG: hypothetical protein ABI896_01715 [Actinomycetota bacterium]